ncbi:MAG TPA: nicotinate-nucleotide--dimethylbenzimidazole phosphoribosyltransferase [Armatimonadota bacterium]|nr:nicotinate-nucleotide--dimethylbenzimidazole phosphoribosyltransferase [Armatimonadota bacterium]
MSGLEDVMRRIGVLEVGAMEGARARQGRLTKPPGSLGRLETISVQVAGIQGRARPEVSQKVVFVMAGDHGVVAQGVSAYPQAVTGQMVANFAAGGAAINVLARQVGARVVVVDMGVAGETAQAARVVHKKVALGTRDITCGQAMSRRQAREAVEAGIEVFEEELGRGVELAATGDMGIGNTTPSAAIIATFTGRPPAEVAGRGTGVDDAGLARKVAVVERALSVNRPDPKDALEVLGKVGGFEIGGLAGVMLAAAANRVPVVIDGVISAAAALVAAGLQPRVKEFMIAGHLSTEPGHRAALEHLGLEPVLDLGMRLGEGTGAALAMGIVEAAVRTLNEMATFEEAGVSGAEGE